MISPENQKIIQIDITNACPHRCSNCTRFSGHVKKPFFMEFDDFRRAIDSLDGYPGMVGIMGGEPTLHPDFERITRYAMEKRPWQGDRKPTLKPIKDFAEYRNSRLSNIRQPLGLWTSLGKKYYEHYELIQEAYPYQCVNDHAHGGKHMPLLIQRKELGIADREWAQYRDNCWLQREWSGSITPKGAFFCEVAGALDTLFDGPGGWDVSEKWWKRGPDQFGDQLRWCEMCSACLPMPSRVASEGVDDVSPEMDRKLKSLGSKKTTVIFDTENYRPEQYRENVTCEPYLPDGKNSARVASTNMTIRPNHLTAIVVCVNYDDYLRCTLPHNVGHFDRYIVVTTPGDRATINAAMDHGVEVFTADRIHAGGAAFAKGRAINDALQYAGEMDWVCIMDADIILPETFGLSVRSMVLNPGALYYTKRWGPKDAAQIPDFMRDLESEIKWHDLYWKYADRRIARKTDRRGNDVEHFPYGYFQLFSPRSSVLKNRELIYPEDSTTAEFDDMRFAYDVFTPQRHSTLPVPEFDVIHLPHGGFKTNWTGRKSPRIGETECTNAPAN